MNHKSEIVRSGIGIMIFAIVIFAGIPTATSLGAEQARTEILEQCQNHQPVTIDGTVIHCGIIGPDVNIEAAEYRAFKNCVKLTEDWVNEQL
jgi:hypothetical protein